MSEYTQTPWRFVELVNDEDGSSLTPEEAAEYSSNTAMNGSTGFYAVQATKEDGKLYSVCFVGNGPDSVANGWAITKAVNYHGRLTETLKDIITCFNHPEWSDRCEEIEGSARDLIKELEAS
jgi:pyruvate/2-oxoglutarate dehydrogenase complex dihydrolipoamide dehydrogenase (E3) component